MSKADFDVPDACVPDEDYDARTEALPVIALVDDDRNILASVQLTLEAEGFVVHSYTDGKSALQGLLSKPVSLAILDVHMPQMDGMELLRRLRTRSNMPVIFLTSKDDEVDQLMGLRLGADDYITKPFSLRLLVERIRALLRRHEISQTGAKTGSLRDRRQFWHVGR